METGFHNPRPQPRVRETRMHRHHVTHVIRSCAVSPSFQPASHRAAGLAWISLRAGELGVDLVACLDLASSGWA